jgi:hypothetical protein
MAEKIRYFYHYCFQNTFMKNVMMAIACVICSAAFAQDTPALAPDTLTTKDTLNLPKEYWEYMAEADSLFAAKDYKAAARVYATAEEGGVRNASRIKHYNAARAWALAGMPDTAFEKHLFKIRLLYPNQLMTDPAFESLRKDPRWQPYLDVVKANQARYAKFNEQIALEAEEIIAEDNKYRMRLAKYEKLYGEKGKETEALRKKIAKQNEVTLAKTTAFLDKYGLVGADVLGEWEYSEMLVNYIADYADLKTQKKYLPILEKGAKDKKKLLAAVAPLADKIQIAQGKPQIYGTQMFMKDGKYEYYPILDEVKADKLRSDIGLESLDINKRRLQGEFIPQTPPPSKGMRNDE